MKHSDRWIPKPVSDPDKPSWSTDGYDGHLNPSPGSSQQGTGYVMLPDGVGHDGSPQFMNSGMLAKAPPSNYIADEALQGRVLPPATSQPSALKEAGIMFAQCAGTFIGGMIASSGISDIARAAHGEESDHRSRLATGAIGAAKVAGGAAAIYFSLVSPRGFSR